MRLLTVLCAISLGFVATPSMAADVVVNQTVDLTQVSNLNGTYINPLFGAVGVFSDP